MSTTEQSDESRHMEAAQECENNANLRNSQCVSCFPFLHQDLQEARDHWYAAGLEDRGGECQRRIDRMFDKLTI